jgi:N-methylhydantoinase B
MQTINGKTTVDPTELAVFRALVEAFLDEMGEALRHGAFSQNIKERRDYSCALFNSSGDLVLGAAHIPVHLGSMDTSCKAAMQSIDFRDGDAALLNDPYSGGTHLPDITLIIPAFLSQGRNPEFYLGVRAHHADVGGIAPGSLPLSTRLEEEGVVVPPTLVVRDGKIIDKTVEKLATSSRQPNERRGDLRAQISSGSVGMKRLKELARNRGLSSIMLDANELIGHSSRVLQSFLSSKEPTSGNGICIMDDIPGEPGAIIHAYVTLEKNPRPRLKVDFSKSSDQHPGCLNAVPAIVRSAVIFTLRLFLPPDTPVTSGLLEPVDLQIRQGSVLNPGSGAAVAGGNVETSQAIVEALLLALGNMGWDIPAMSQGTMNNVLLGNIGKSDRTFSFYETIGGGAGGSYEKQGESGIQSHMTNTRNTPIETLEREYPLLVREYSFRDMSGGNGKNYGGDGIVREIEILSPAKLTILSHHRKTGPSGAMGGEPGKPGKNILIRDGKETELPARVMVDLKAGDIIRIETPGGGGYGKAC